MKGLITKSSAASIFFFVVVVTTLSAGPIWKAPPQLKLGELQSLELRESDPSQPTLPRPALEEKLGPLRLRAMEPLEDGRGWRFQVQALQPGLAVIPPLDLGDGRRAPELRIQVPRTMPFGGPWIGFGGSSEDLLPAIEFPWAWASLLLLPVLALLLWGFLFWRKRRSKRAWHKALHGFQAAWPPKKKDREHLDEAHAKGRALLAARLGEAAASWGPSEFQSAHMGPWDQWTKSLDAARFGRTEPPFPALDPLLNALNAAATERERSK